MVRVPDGKPGTAASEGQRIDRWLWFTRIVKSRTAAAQLVADGKVRVNRARVLKPSHPIRTGDVLTIAQRGKIRIVKVLAPGHRRGPSAEAKELYEALSNPPGRAA